MTVISPASASLLDRIGASRAALAAPPGRQSTTAAQPTRVTLGSSNATAVYTDPRARPGFVRLWATPPAADDAVSAVMARNRSMSAYRLADQWRGLGGALLAQFGKTGADYAQTVVDELPFAADTEPGSLPPEGETWRTAQILARQTAALANVATGVPTAGLRVQTRSGQSVELQIAVNSGINGIIGTKVALTSSGAMNDDERAAVAKLAEGLDRALEGLGGDAVGLDLAGLLAYDRGALASVDLTVSSQPYQSLGSFSLHLGGDKRTVALKGSDGAMNLSVDAGKPLGTAATLQRTLDRMDAAGQRGRANAALVAQMKSAFEQLQAAQADDNDNTALTSSMSGLADFEASMSGDTWRSNRHGAHNEAGQVDWRLSQKTRTTGSRSMAQTVSEQLSADYRKAPGDRMLDVTTGEFTAIQVRDSSTATTLIDALPNQTPRVLRKTDEQQLKTVTAFENHRTVNRQSWPSQHSFMERLA